MGIWKFNNYTVILSKFFKYCTIKITNYIRLTNNSEPITFTNNELISLNCDYLFILIDFENENYHIELYMLMGDSKYVNKKWLDISIVIMVGYSMVIMVWYFNWYDDVIIYNNGNMVEYNFVLLNNFYQQIYHHIIIIICNDILYLCLW